MHNSCFCCCHRFLVSQHGIHISTVFFKKNLCDFDHFWTEFVGGKQSPTSALTHNVGRDPQRGKSTMGCKGQVNSFAQCFIILWSKRWKRGLTVPRHLMHPPRSASFPPSSSPSTPPTSPQLQCRTGHPVLPGTAVLLCPATLSGTACFLGQF